MSVVVTGCAGFIGSFVSAALAARGERVIGVDNMNAYYDVALKGARLARLEGLPGFAFHRLDVTDAAAMNELADRHDDIEAIIHLAAQAGVRYSLIDPLTYVDTNVRGQVVMLEAARRLKRLKSFVYASSSSVYGRNTQQPFRTEDRADHPVSLYAATKRAGELVTESQCRLFGLPCTGLRFFTVYGPWGRPDMAYYLFTAAILAGRPIQVFNHGNMRRDFTCIDDVVPAVLAAAGPAPAAPGEHRLYNIGNNRPEPLADFIAILERAIGQPAIKQFVGMHPGDVETTYADIEPARRDLNYDPKTAIADGLPRFVEWFREYHRPG